jgi:uncharacterized membrane protein YphA (DoxX/SURF4 family)
MTNFEIPIIVVYVGLGATLLALLVATIVNRWSARVFFLLALRLAIGWQFLFEGLYKVQSHYGPPAEGARAFSSEPYFRAAPGPVGPYMRKQFSDPAEVIAEKVKMSKDISPEKFVKMPVADQAAACPTAVASQIDSWKDSTADYIKRQAEKQLANVDTDLTKKLDEIDKEVEKELKDAKTDEDKNKAKAKADADRKGAKDKAEETRQKAQKAIETNETLAQELVRDEKIAYARWVYGVDGRDTKVKYFNGDVPLTAPVRLAHIEWLRGELKSAEERLNAGLGNGNNIDTKHVAELRTDLISAESDLAKDANNFVNEINKEMTGKAPEEITPTTWGHTMDKYTMWFLVAVGACLMAGLLTRLACILAAGFLVMTYLAFPPFPWFPVAPNTEGNPLFINKNVIETLALLALACMPTGRWLGLDALFLRPFCRYKGECRCPQPQTTVPPNAPRR